MKKQILAYFLFVAVILATALFLAGPSAAKKGSCDFFSVCPTHGVEAQFTGTTKIVSRGCVYGKYKHGACTHWAKCYCPGEE